jgi:UDP-N-acetylglucosamine acyltransferase
MANIHPTAIIDPAAELDQSVEVGAYTLIGAGVKIGAGTRVGPHCVIEAGTSIGRDNRIWQFCSIGGDPQDKKYAGEPTTLEIGDRNTIREYCTFNRGTVQDAGVTRIGSDNWIMAYVHVAHDCQIGNNVIIANSVQFAGHVHMGDWAIIGGMTGIHQFVKIGAHAMSGMCSALSKDLPPYVMCSGDPAAPYGINTEGLKRRGFTPEQIENLRRAYKIIYRSGHTVEAARAELETLVPAQPELRLFLDFFAASTRGIIR